MRVLISFILLAGLSARASARPAEYEVNVREACRQAVAGGYLKAYDERERVISYSQALSEQIRALTASLKDARATFEKAKTALANAAFDLDHAARRDEAATVVANLEAQLKDYQRLKTTADADVGKRRTEEARLRRAIEPIFLFERVDDKADGGYPIHLAYRAPCPKYRALCPLPPKDAERLASLTIEGEVPEACRRYSSLGKIR